MAGRARIGISTTQALRLSPGLTTGLAILRMDSATLAAAVDEMAAANPWLQRQDAPPPVVWTPRWCGAFRLARAAAEAPDATDRIAASGPSLAAHVLGRIDQMAWAPGERDIALTLAEALEPWGWLGQPVETVARRTGATPAMVLSVLRRLQGVEPVGLFARSLAECLRLQAEEAGEADALMLALLDRLDLVAAGDLAALGRRCGADEAALRATLRRLRAYDPKPGAQFDPGATPQREPDLIVTRGADGWQVALNRSVLPDLVLADPAPDAARGDRARAAARDLLRAVEARGQTMLRLARHILILQAAALEQGLSALVPMSMAEVAAALEVHETTVSRVVAGTVVDTPRGTWALRALFGSAVPDSDRARPGQPPLSAAALPAVIAALVAAEPAGAPLSDEALAERLQDQGRAVARRTVAKYRMAAGIPPAHRRRTGANAPQPPVTDMKGRRRG